MYYLHNLKKNEYSLISKKNIFVSEGDKNKFINHIKILNKIIEGNKYLAINTKKYKKYKKELTIN